VINHYTRGVVTRASRQRLERAIRTVDRAVLFDLQLVVGGYLQETGPSIAAVWTSSPTGSGWRSIRSPMA
jgi:hypothetical protein